MEKRVNIPSYSLSDGDEISIKDNSKDINLIVESISSQEEDTRIFRSRC